MVTFPPKIVFPSACQEFSGYPLGGAPLCGYGVLSSGGRGFDRTVCIDASDSSDLKDCIDLSDLKEEALMGWSGGYWRGLMGGDSGIMSLGRTAIGLGDDDVGILNPPVAGDFAEPPFFDSSVESGTLIGGTDRLLEVPSPPSSG